MPSNCHPPAQNPDGSGEPDASQPKCMGRYYVDCSVPSEGDPPAQTPGGSVAEPDTSQSKRIGRYYGVLPVARGFRNGFTGETVDAGCYASLYCLARVHTFLLWEAWEEYSKLDRKKRLSQANGETVPRQAIKVAAINQSAYIGAGLLAGFTLLSRLGISYRSWTEDY